MFFRIPAVLLFLVVGASAAPGVEPLQVSVQQSRRDVWAPPIIEPHKGAIWHIGSTATVTWYVWMMASGDTSMWRELDPLLLFTCRNTSSRPAVTNPTGTLLLGYLQSDGEGGENLDVGQSSRRMLAVVSCLTSCRFVFRSSPCERLQSGRREGQVRGPTRQA